MRPFLFLLLALAACGSAPGDDMSKVLAARGLYTNANALSSLPEGAFLRADDVVVDRPGEVETRRGFEALAGTFPAESLTVFQGVLLAHGAGRLARYVAGAWVDFPGTWLPPPGGRVRFAEAAKALYFTTASGVYRLDSPTDTPVPAGVLRPPSLIAAKLAQGSGVGGTGFLAPDSLVGYRVVWGKRLANGRLLLSAPSGREVVSNPLLPARLRRTGGTFTTVAAAVPAGTIPGAAGDTIEVTPVDANNPAPSIKTVTGQASSDTSGYTAVAYTEAGPAIDLSIDGYTLSFRTRPVQLNVFLPAGVDSSYFLQVYRTRSVASAVGDPGDDMALVYEAYPTASELSSRLMVVVDIVPDDLRGAALYSNETQEGALQANIQPPLADEVATFQGCLVLGNTAAKHRLQLSLLAVGGSSGLAAGDVLTIGGRTYTASSTGGNTLGTFSVATYPLQSVAQYIEAVARDLVRAINTDARTPAPAFRAFYASGPDDAPGRILLEEVGVGGAAISVTASAHGGAWAPSLPTSGTSVSSDNDVDAAGLYFSKPLQPDAVPVLNRLRVGSPTAKLLRLVALQDVLFVLKEDGIWRLTGTSPLDFRVEPHDTTVRLLAPDTAVALNNRVWALTNQGVVAFGAAGSPEILSFPVEDSLLELLAAAPDAVSAQAWAVAYESDRKYLLALPSDPSDTAATQLYVFNYLTRAWTRWTRGGTCGAVSPADDRLHVCTAAGGLVRERKSRTGADYQDEGGQAVVADVLYPPQTEGAPEAAKHFRVLQLFFAGAPPTAVDVTFASELSTTSPPVTLSGANGTQPGTLSTWVTAAHARCGQLSVSVRHGVVGQPMRLLGYALSARTYRTRAAR